MRELSYVIYEVDQGVAVITLNRPEKRNALNGGLLDELDYCLGEARQDDGVRVVVIRGAGPSFCAGY